MVELSMEYMNKLASQTQFISALLCGFSLTVLVLLFEKKDTNNYIVHIFRLAILATSSFLVAIFSMTNILMRTTEGFPFPVSYEDLMLPRIIGILAFFIGLISITFIISLFGWTKSKKLGRFSTIIGILTFILLLMMVT